MDALTNVDGGNPNGGLVISGNVLYGTTWEGGSNGNGTLYSIQTDTSNFAILHTFSLPYVTTLSLTNSDGSKPHQTLALAGNVLYGTTSQGGPGGYGTVFKVNTDGRGFTNLHYFTLGTDGINPQAGLLVSNDTVYGTTSFGGTGGGGTVFKVNTDGTGYKTLHNFGSSPNDGAGPNGPLVLADGVLYGTAAGGGGASGSGVVFAVGTNGAGYTNVYVFTGRTTPGTISTNTSGETPCGGLVLAGNTLYGCTTEGQTNGTGLVFSVHTDGTGYTNLHVFSFADSQTTNTNSDGANPICTLLLSGSALYGTASGGGTNGLGTVFAVNTNGAGFTNLYTFANIVTFIPTFENIGGAGPAAGLVLSSNILYGTTDNGGFAEGNVFALSLPSSAALPSPVPLSIQGLPGSIVLSWTGTGFSLQSTSSLEVPFTNVPGAVSPYPVSTTNTQRFFRLVKN